MPNGKTTLCPCLKRTSFPFSKDDKPLKVKKGVFVLRSRCCPSIPMCMLYSSFWTWDMWDA